MEDTENRNVTRSLLSIAAPIAIQNLAIYLAGLADGILSGRLGDGAVSGVYMGNLVAQLLTLLVGGIEGTVLLLSSQYKGRSDRESIRKIASIGVKIAVILGFLTTIICTFLPNTVISILTNKREFIDTGVAYLSVCCLSFPFFCLTQSLVASLRSVGKARMGLWFSLIFLGVKIPLGIALVFGKVGIPPLGIIGIGVATVVARAIEALTAAIYCFGIDGDIALRVRHLHCFDRKMLADMIRLGAPIMLGQIVWAVNLFSASAIMGRLSHPGAVAAMGVAGSLQALGYVAVNAVSSALGVITGRLVGGGKVDHMKRFTNRVLKLLAVFGAALGLTLYLVRIPFATLFPRLSPEALEQSMLLTIVASVSMSLTGFQIPCFFGLIKSGGDVWFVLRCDLITVLLVTLPAGVIAYTLGAPPWALLVCLRLDQAIKCVITAKKVPKLDWMKNLTRAGS